MIAEPNSLAAEAYRGLAAMSIATDRLPKAMMVSTPDRRRARPGRGQLRGRALAARAQGRADGDVGRAGLVPRGVHAERQRHGPRCPSCSSARTAARCPTGWRERLPVTEYAPNLVVVPPADEPLLHLPDRRAARAAPGALRRRGRRDGHRRPAAARRGRRDDRRVGDAQHLVGDHPRRGHPRRGARAAAARMELAGVTPFGVVMVEPQTIGV